MKRVKEFKVIECRGTAYEIGRQWGEGCKESILKVSENIFNIMNLMYQSPREEVISRAMKLFPLVQKFDPYLLEIMKGQADTTGLSLEEIFTQKCMNELMFQYNNLAGLCTSFAATGKATQDGKTILEQNIDFFPETPIDLLKVYHSDGPVQFILSFANAGEFTFSSAGFGICANATIGKDYSYNIIPVACYLPKVMRQKNIYDAMDILKHAIWAIIIWPMQTGKCAVLKAFITILKSFTRKKTCCCTPIIILRNVLKRVTPQICTNPTATIV